MRIYMFLLFAFITVVANIGYRIVWYGPNESLWAFFFDLIVVVVPLIVAFVIFTVALVQIRKISVEHGKLLVKEDMMAYHLGFFGTFVVTILILGFAVQARANASYDWLD